MRESSAALYRSPRTNRPQFCDSYCPVRTSVSSACIVATSSQKHLFVGFPGSSRMISLKNVTSLDFLVPYYLFTQFLQPSATLLRSPVATPRLPLAHLDLQEFASVATPPTNCWRGFASLDRKVSRAKVGGHARGTF